MRRASAADKGRQLANVAGIGRSQGFQVDVSDVAIRHEIGSLAPGKGPTSRFVQQAVRHQPRVPAIAVGKSMDQNELLMKARSDFGAVDEASSAPGASRNRCSCRIA
jgi:hypothetical protein